MEHRLAGESIEEIARILHVGHAVVNRTLQVPEVQAAISEAHAETRSRVVHRLSAIAPEMIDVLLELARDTEAPDAVRRAAASDLLDRCGVTKSQVVEVVAAPLDAIALDDEIRRLLGPVIDVESEPVEPEA